MPQPPRTDEERRAAAARAKRAAELRKLHEKERQRAGIPPQESRSRSVRRQKQYTDTQANDPESRRERIRRERASVYQEPEPAAERTRQRRTAPREEEVRPRSSRSGGFTLSPDFKRNLALTIALVAAIVIFILLVSSIVSCAKGTSSSRVSSSSSSSRTSGNDTAEGSASSDEEGEQEPAAPTEAPKPVTLTVSVVGDCTLGTDAYFDYDNSLNAYFEMYGSAYFMQNVKSIFEADDLTIANFEGVLTESNEREDKEFAFKAPASFAKILTDGSIETVNTANNHSHDYGDQGFQDTMDALDAENIVHFGYDETAVVDVKGVKVGLVGIYELKDHLERTQQLKDNIAKVKADGAQQIIVIFHWGNEKEQVPDTNQMTLGRLAIDEGADLVCGHHPHVLQGIEVYKGRNIVYSLANFCFGGNQYPSDMDTMIFQQTFTVTGDEVAMDNVTNVIPTSISSDYGYNNYQPTPAEGDEATRIMNKINERSSWIETAEPQNTASNEGFPFSGPSGNAGETNLPLLPEDAHIVLASKLLR